MWITKIFKNKSLSLSDLSVLKADMHSHLIPGIDDGVQTLEESLDTIYELSVLGYKKLITTPHILKDIYPNNPRIIKRGLEKVQYHVKKNRIPVEIEAAAEYYMDDDFEQYLKEGELLSFGKERYVLFELSFSQPTNFLYKHVNTLIKEGYKPILAHPERYPYWHTDLGYLRKLKDEGVLLQVNINSLIGRYSTKSKKAAERIIDENLVDLLGTDTHGIGQIDLLYESLSNSYVISAIESGNLINRNLL